MQIKMPTARDLLPIADGDKLPPLVREQRGGEIKMPTVRDLLPGGVGDYKLPRWAQWLVVAIILAMLWCWLVPLSISGASRIITPQ
jgi:hypothetical protein